MMSCNNNCNSMCNCGCNRGFLSGGSEAFWIAVVIAIAIVWVHCCNNNCGGCGCNMGGCSSNGCGDMNMCC